MSENKPKRGVGRPKGTKEHLPLYYGPKRTVSDRYKRRASMLEAAKTNNIKYYGIKRIDAVIEKMLENNKPLTGKSAKVLMVEISGLRGKMNKIRKDLPYERDALKKKLLREEYNKLYDEVKALQEKKREREGLENPKEKEEEVDETDPIYITAAIKGYRNRNNKIRFFYKDDDVPDAEKAKLKVEFSENVKKINELLKKKNTLVPMSIEPKIKKTKKPLFDPKDIKLISDEKFDKSIKKATMTKEIINRVKDNELAKKDRAADKARIAIIDMKHKLAKEQKVAERIKKEMALTKEKIAKEQKVIEAIKPKGNAKPNIKHSKDIELALNFFDNADSLPAQIDENSSNKERTYSRLFKKYQKILFDNPDETLYDRYFDLSEGMTKYGQFEGYDWKKRKERANRHWQKQQEKDAKKGPKPITFKDLLFDKTQELTALYLKKKINETTYKKRMDELDDLKTGDKLPIYPESN